MMHLGPIVGVPSGGSTGQPIVINVPGGGSARICVKRDSYADGTDFVGVGVQPDVLQDHSKESVRRGSDPVLERAVMLVLQTSVGIQPQPAVT